MTRSDDTGKFILRFALGILILLHGIGKLRTGVGFVSGQLVAHGLPAVLAYLAYVGEIVAPLMLIAGFYARIGAWILVLHMVTAIWLAHSGQLLSIGKNGESAIELQYLFLASALAIALLGAGRFSVAGSGGRLN